MSFATGWETKGTEEAVANQSVINTHEFYANDASLDDVVLGVASQAQDTKETPKNDSRGAFWLDQGGP